MAGNDNTKPCITDKSRVSLPLGVLIAILLGVMAAAVGWGAWANQTRTVAIGRPLADDLYASKSSVYTKSEADKTFLYRTEYETRHKEIMDAVTRIGDKIDKQNELLMRHMEGSKP
jgi:hypothetical protein